MTPIEGLHDVLNTLRRQHRRRLALEGIGALVIAVAAALVFGALLTRTLGITGTGVWTVRALGYSLVLAAAFWWLLRPLIRRASDAEFAHYVEARAPGLRQALLTAVEHGSDTQRSSALSTRVVENAVRQLRPLAAARSIESAPERKAVRTLGVAAALLIAAIALGPSQVRDAARVLFAPWSVAIAATPPAPIVNVEPGDITVPRGGALDVRAALEHFSADGAELVFKSDSAQEWIRLPMGRDAESFVSRLFDITAPSQYYVEASGIRSRTHRIRVADLPAVQRIAIELRFPAYTGREPERDEDGGDVAAMKGTTVIVEPTITRPVREGALTFDDGTTVPLTLGTDGKLSGRFEVRANGFYRVDLVSEEGRRVVGGVQYAIEALEDRPPAVRIETPGRDTKVGALDEVTIEAVASDDYGVRGLELRYRVNGGIEQSVTLRAATSAARAETQGAHTLMLEDLELKPGDLIAYNAAARDGAGQEALSDIYFLEIRPFTRDYRQAESGQPGGMGQGEESAGDFVQRQREIVAGTYNWVRDSARKSERERNEDLTTLAIAQGRLKDEVSRLAAQMLARGVTNSDSTFAFIQSTLDSAAILMRDAEERLGKREGRLALPPEERALAYVQRADAAYREVQLQAQQEGGGGGGGQQSNAEDLADLFELETDRMRNQYESVQQQAQASQTREVDETLERLRQLASRQQQENERLQRQAEAMRERMGRQTAGGGGGSQRELAQQAEEEARRLERLSREQQSQELADAAQQMQRAADAMRRSATGSESDGAQALEQLERAARQVEAAQSRGLTDNVRDLAERARDLEQRQDRIAEGVRQSLRAAGVERAQQQNRLNEEKARLAEDVERLEADADRLSREARRDQPESASGLREAADGIRDQRVRDKIQFSRSVMRSGSPEYANTFEEQIGDNLAEASEKLRGAVSALRDESAARQQERTREQARALVQGVESLGERLGGEQEGETGQPGQAGQEGQQGQQGRGQQGQGQQGQGQQGQQGQGQQGQGQQGQGQQGQEGEQGQAGSRQGEGAAQPGGASQGRPSGQLSANDARQFAREFSLRRQAAEQLRDLARAQDVDVGELDRAIRDLRRLESERGLTDLRTSAALQAEVLERLKTFEFSLNRQLSPDAERRGALGARSPVPSEYRAEVEEYYRSLARPRP